MSQNSPFQASQIERNQGRVSEMQVLTGAASAAEIENFAELKNKLTVKGFFKYGRRYGRGSPRLSWQIFPEYSKNNLRNWGLRPQFLR